LVVVDFECTCEDQEEPFVHEIIEFPAVLLDTITRREERHFHAFVKPTERPVLSEFCTRLTGIDQSKVDEAEPLDRVLVKFGAWLDEFVGEDYSLAADCQSDLRHFLLAECRRKKIRVRDAWRSWVDIGRHLMVHFDLRRPGNLQMKLAKVGLAFEGTPHRGLDDARNIGRLALALQARGVSLTVNDGVVRPRRSAVTKKEKRLRSREEEARRRRRKPVVVDW
jgi:inhibitor of KinA sporulation pathway (predicted exonuclease)